MKAPKEALEKIKIALGITGEYVGKTVEVWIDEVMGYMASAGVDEEVINNASTAGVIARGVIDIWDHNSGAGKLSDYFHQRVAQLAMKKVDKDDKDKR